MSTKKSNSPKYSKLDSWLGSLGFNQGNPFANTEAEQERALLPDYFVDVDGYEKIKGDHTVVIFAPRGGGKSALRVVLASYAAPVLPEAEILAIEYTDFSKFIFKLNAGEKLSIEDYANQLLRVGTEALLFALCGASPNMGQGSDSSEVRHRRMKRIEQIKIPARSRISQWLRTYAPGRLRAEELYERLQAIKPAFAPEWKQFVNTYNGHQLREMLGQSAIARDEMALLLADINDFSAEPFDPSFTPIEKISNFVSLARSCGFKSVHFLLDGVDESQETANNPNMQADILEPLLAELHILELPGTAFKFFLSREAHKELMERPTIRKDRLTDKALTVEWGTEKLKALLDTRLEYFSEGAVQDFVQICQESMMEAGRGQVSTSVGDWIEKEMLRASNGSPRRLLTAGKLLFDAHASIQKVKELIELNDWERAKKELDRKMPLPLILSLDANIVWVGERKVELSALNQKILSTLATVNGVCDRDHLTSEAWDAKEGVSPQAVDKAVSRLRVLLGDDPVEPTYLRTIRGQGFQLLHFELA
jgi:hypothetical protein